MGNESISKVSLPLSQLRILSSLLLLSLLILPLAPWVFGDSSKDADVRARAIALFAKALAVSDLRAPGSPPFEMRGTINVEASHGKSATATYLLEWASPERWREEIHFANYSRIRVGGKDQYWQSRTTPYEILPLLQLDPGLDFFKDLHVWSRNAAMADLGMIKFHRKKAHGIKLECVTLMQKGEKYGPDYCFDPATGTLDSSNSIEFSNFISFDGKFFPGNIRVEEDTLAQPITFQVNSITPLSSVAEADFHPPENSTGWPSCDDPDNLPVLKFRAFPVYPVADKMSHRDGAVLLYALIGADGEPAKVTVFSAPDLSLANSAFTAVKQWKYLPATCGGAPVPSETLITVIFNWGPG